MAKGLTEKMQDKLRRNREQYSIATTAEIDEIATTPQRLAPGQESDTEATWIERDRIDPNPFQPRRRFDATTLRELGESMRVHSQLQPCLVRPHPNASGRFQLIAGERRWRAAFPEFGDLPRLRCIVRSLSDQEALVMALEENAKREDLNVIERARALFELKNVSPGRHSAKKATWQDVAQMVGMARSSVDRYIQLLSLPEDILATFERLNLNEKHGRALLMLNNDVIGQRSILKQIEQEELSGNQAISRAEELLGRTRNRGDDEEPASFTPGIENVSPGRHFGGSADEPEHHKSNTRSPGASISQPAIIQVSVPATPRDTSPDPITGAIQPAASFLAEARRQLRTLSLSAEYRWRVRQELDQVQQQIDEVRKLVE
jgi:ParB family chromosome partitioning protein